jgi:hypothetical protein
VEKKFEEEWSKFDVEGKLREWELERDAPPPPVSKPNRAPSKPHLMPPAAVRFVLDAVMVVPRMSHRGGRWTITASQLC